MSYTPYTSDTLLLRPSILSKWRGLRGLAERSAIGATRGGGWYSSGASGWRIGGTSHRKPGAYWRQVKNCTESVLEQASTFA